MCGLRCPPSLNVRTVGVEEVVKNREEGIAQMRKHANKIGWTVAILIVVGGASFALLSSSATATPTRSYSFTIDPQHVWRPGSSGPAVVATVTATGTWDHGATVDIFMAPPGGGVQTLVLRGGSPSAGAAESRTKTTAQGIASAPSGTVYQAVFSTYDGAGNVNWTANSTLILP